MTREEIIKEVAGTYAKDACNPASKRGLLYDGFVDGAEWADEHPKLVATPLEEIENVAKDVIDKDWQARQDRLWNMIERNFRAQFIRNACEWMDRYIDNYLFVDMEDAPGIRREDFINDFRQVMKGE